jgi:argininosuccinate lyase
MGRARAVLDVMHNTPFTDMNDSEGETQDFGYEAFASAARVLVLLTQFVRLVRVDSARVAENIDRSAICITELADSLVRRENLSFREGHEIASATARAVAAAAGRLAADGYAPFRAAFAKATGRQTAITPAEFAELVSPAHFVAVRTRYGGPAPAPLGAAIGGYRHTAATLAREAGATAEREAEAARQLDAAFAALAAR